MQQHAAESSLPLAAASPVTSARSASALDHCGSLARGVMGSSEQSAADPARRSIVRDALLHTLSHQERLLVILWHVEHMTPAEIASLMGTTVRGVVEQHEDIVARLRGAVQRAA